MRTIVNTIFDIGDEIFMISINKDDIVKVKVHMIKMEWHPYGKGLHYDVTPIEDGKYIKKGDYLEDIGEEWLCFTQDEANAKTKRL